MLNRYLTYYKAPLQFTVLCLILSLALFLGSYASTLLMEKISGISFEDLKNIKTSSLNLSIQLKIINTVGNGLILCLPSFLFAYLAFPSPAEYLNFKLKIKPHHWLWAITFLLIALPFSSLLEQWCAKIPALANSKELDELYKHQADLMLHGSSSVDLITNIIFMAIFPAFIEELFFRGCLLQVLINWNRKIPIVMIVLVGLLFSAFHAELTGFIPRLFLGSILGLAFYFTGSIWVSIIMHALNNIIVIMIIHFQKAGLVSNNLPDISLLLGFGSAVAVAYFGYQFYKDRTPFILHEVPKDEEDNLTL